MDCRPEREVATAVVVGTAAHDVRRAVGPTSWCVLEVLAATPADSGEPWVVPSSVRHVAAQLGIAANTAQRALAVLRDAGLVTPSQRRELAGRFGGGTYVLTVDSDVLDRRVLESVSVAQPPVAAPRPRAAAAPVLHHGEQLALLSSA